MGVTTLAAAKRMYKTHRTTNCANEQTYFLGTEPAGGEVGEGGSGKRRGKKVGSHTLSEKEK